MIVYRELSTVEKDLGVSAHTLYALSNSINKHYKVAYIPKRDGTVRCLFIPDSALKSVQKKIAEKLLAYEKVSSYARAYKPMSSIWSNARPHVGKNNLLKLDILKFFDNVSYSSVKKYAFPKERYSEKIRVLLSILCYHLEELPQGAPTSPAISNLVLYDFDCTVGEWCRQRGISYTRYCDDMTFSGDFDSEELQSFVARELSKYGFLLNFKKCRIAPKGRLQRVCGVTVNDCLSVGNDYIRKIRSECYYIKKFGLASHLEHIGYEGNPKSYLKGLLGRIDHAMQGAVDKGLAEYKELIKNELMKLGE